jgi:hypothetical protein
MSKAIIINTNIVIWPLRILSFAFAAYCIKLLQGLLSDLLSKISGTQAVLEFVMRLSPSFFVFLVVAYACKTSVRGLYIRRERIIPVLLTSLYSLIAACLSVTLNALSVSIFWLKQKKRKRINFALNDLGESGSLTHELLNVVLIAGTFQGSNAASNPCPEIKTYLENHIQHRRIKFYSFGWTGGNSFSERIKRAFNLAFEVRKLTRKTNGKTLVIGHSHGGSIAAMAATLNKSDSRQYLVKYIGLASPLLLPHPVILKFFETKKATNHVKQVLRLAHHWVMHSTQGILLPLIIFAFAVTGTFSFKYLFSTSMSSVVGAYFYPNFSNFEYIYPMLSAFLFVHILLGNAQLQKKTIRRFLRFGVLFYAAPPQNLALWRVRNDFVATLICRIPTYKSTTSAIHFVALRKIYQRISIHVAQFEPIKKPLSDIVLWPLLKVLTKVILMTMLAVVCASLLPAESFMNVTSVNSQFHFFILQALAGGLLLFTVFGTRLSEIIGHVFTVTNALTRMIPYIFMGSARSMLTGMNVITASSFLPFILGKLSHRHLENQTFNFGRKFKPNPAWRHSEIRRNEQVLHQLLAVAERW